LTVFVIKHKTDDMYYTGQGWSKSKDDAKGYPSKPEAQEVINRHGMTANVTSQKGDADDHPGEQPPG
jgi:hypothetical protein